MTNSSDITIIPPFRFYDDVSIPFVDVSDQETFLQNIANPLIVLAIKKIYPGANITINAEGNIDVNGVEFSTKFDLCQRTCLCGRKPFGGCVEDDPCPPGKIRINCECVEPPPPTIEICQYSYRVDHTLLNIKIDGVCRTRGEFIFPVATRIFQSTSLPNDTPWQSFIFSDGISTQQLGEDSFTSVYFNCEDEEVRRFSSTFEGISTSRVMYRREVYRVKVGSGPCLPIDPPLPYPPLPPEPCDEEMINLANAVKLADYLAQVASNLAAYQLALATWNIAFNLWLVEKNVTPPFLNGFEQSTKDLFVEETNLFPPVFEPVPPPTYLSCP